MLFVTMGASAQVLRIQLYHYGEGGRKVAAQNVPLYFFYGENKANEARKKLTEYELPNRRSGFSSSGKTNNKGALDLNGEMAGFLLIDAGNYIDDPQKAAIVLNLQKIKATQDESGNIFSFEYTIDDKVLKSEGHMSVTTMKDADATAKMASKRKPKTKAITNGKDVEFSSTIYIDSAYARNDARFVVTPFLICPSENNDTIGFFLPRVVDGCKYEKTMVRRMGGVPGRDKLNKYKEEDIKMQLRKSDSFKFTQKIYNFDYSRLYNARGHIWYEDYNSVYHHDLVRLWNGRFINYNRFLDWSSAQPDAELDPTHYERIGVAESKDYRQSYKIQFALGSSKIDRSDSTTVRELEKLKDAIRRYYELPEGADSRLATDTIRGYSSPEGASEASNRSLAHSRATSLSAELKGDFPNRHKFPEPIIAPGVVVPWTEVADTLEAIGDSTSLDIAREIREIAQQVSSIDGQSSRITKKSWYASYVKPEILPRMRRSELIYKAITMAVRTPDEIYDMYRTQSGYNKGLLQRDYEYYELMNRLYSIGDWEGLSRIAEQALKSPELAEDVTRTDTLGSHMELVYDSLTHKQDTTFVYDLKPESDVYSRPYPLAAYYKARCLLQSGKVDTKLLEAYLDYSRQGAAGLKKNFQQEERGWWNEEAIVLTQVQMLCADNDYSKANFVLDDHLPNSDKYKRLRMFLLALKGEYNNTEVRDTVAASSPMNYLVAWCGYADKMDDESGYRRALALINGTMEPLESWGEAELDSTDARVHYMKAICRYKVECPKMFQEDDGPLLPSTYLYNPDEPENCWAAPMLEAIRLDKSNIEYLNGDGNFEDPYRALLLFFAERLQTGMSMDDIKTEYDTLYKKYLQK